MVKIVAEEVFQRPAPDLFDLVADPEHEIAWETGVTSVEKLTPGPVGRGARYRAHFRRFGTLEYTFVDFDQGHHFVREATLPFGHVRHRFQFHPVADGGTEVVQTIQIERRGIWNVLVPVLSFFGRRYMRALFEDMENALARQG